MNTANEDAWITGAAYGVSEAGHMWSESKYNHASALYLDANFEEAFKIDDVSSVFHYKPVVTLADWPSSITSGEHNNECRVSNGLLCEDEIANLTLAVCLPKISQDQIMDVDFAKNVPELDFKICDGELIFENSRSAINSPENSDVSDAQQTNKSNVEHCTQPTEVNQVNKLTEADILSTICLSTNDPFAEEKVRSRQRRLCHRPKKYAEESPILKPRRSRPKKYLTRSSKDKDLGVVSQKKYHAKFCNRKAAKVSGRNLKLDLDDEYTPCASGVRRLKTRHDNKQWTLDEVVELLDGIAHFGLGRWTAIQKTFLTSSCRTPTDVRDKWRNLVKANCGALKKKRKDQRQGRSLPNAIIERVRELAMTIPKCRSEHEEKL